MIKTKSLSRLIIILLIFIFAAWLSFSNFSFFRKDKSGGVAYVSYTKTLKESTILAQENTHNDKIRLLANVATNKMLKKYYSLPEPIRREIRMIKNIKMNNELRSEQGRTRRISHKVIEDAIEEYRVENHYSMIFNKDISGTPDDGKDISVEIINKLKDTKVDYGELPKFDENNVVEYSYR